MVVSAGARSDPICELAWSFSGPDGRATWEWTIIVDADKQPWPRCPLAEARRSSNLPGAVITPCRCRSLAIMAQSLAQLIDEITVDAHDTDEQLSGFLQVFQDEVTVPVGATVLGMTVEVTSFELEGDERRGLVARCRHQGTKDAVSLADVHFESISVAGWLHAAYRTWLCLPPFPAESPSGWAWPVP